MSSLPVLTARLVVPGYRGLQNPELIIRIESRNNYTLFYLRALTQPLRVSRTKVLLKSHAEPLLVSGTVKYFQQQLPGFIRVSRTSLLNPQYIDKALITGKRSMQVHLLDGTILEVSRRRITDTTDKLVRYKKQVSPERQAGYLVKD